MTLYTGKHPFTADERDLKLEKYLDTTKVHVPWDVGHADKMPQPRLMLGNGPDDSVAPDFGGAGDCVLAMVCNGVRLASAIGGLPIPPLTGKEAIAAYSEVTGYVLNDENTDRGTDVRTALKWWQKTGIKDANGVRHKLGAYALIPQGQHAEWFQALLQLDVGVALGINFPTTAMDQFNANEPWKVVANMEDDGGHCILLDYRRQWPMVETWARDQPATEPFLEKQVEEAWALFMPEMLVDGKSIEGLDLAQLKADLATL